MLRLVMQLKIYFFKHKDRRERRKEVLSLPHRSTRKIFTWIAPK